MSSRSDPTTQLYDPYPIHTDHGSDTAPTDEDATLSKYTPTPRSVPISRIIPLLSAMTDPGPSGSGWTPSKTNVTSSGDGAPKFHIHPHSAHVQRSPQGGGGVEDEEEHDYEALPVGAGWGVNMAAGAMVSVISSTAGQ